MEGIGNSMIGRLFGAGALFFEKDYREALSLHRPGVNVASLA
jgi:hypothetical protein